MGQVDTPLDTVPVLKYSIDTTILSPDEDSALMIGEDTEMSTDENISVEYFLRKEFTGGFGDSLKLRKLPDSVVRKFDDDEAFWYANGVFRKKKQEQATEGRDFTASPFFQTLLWFIIIGGFATFLMMYLYNSNAGLFRKSRNIDVETGDPETSDIFAINYQKEIDKAISSQEYRLAVRLMYLKLLKELSDRNFIQYKHDNTNLDYLLQLQPTAMYRDFFRLTRNYEYCWYGQFEIDGEKFSIIKKDFEFFDRKLY